MGKTFKDIKKFDVKRHKQAARREFKEEDLRTRMKPVQKIEKGGARNKTQEILSTLEEEDA